ncbi:MAG: hypothetical protein LC808_14745, partial [Actinobacteria bacterium]|nr:hypothetical protein [Actinomycetota bacterium]
MNRLVERCAGLDVHKATVTATVRVPGEGGERHQETQTFPTTTRALLVPLDWLQSHKVTLVGRGVHRRLLEARVLPTRGPLRMLAAQRPAS